MSLICTSPVIVTTLGSIHGRRAHAHARGTVFIYPLLRTCVPGWIEASQGFAGE